MSLVATWCICSDGNWYKEPVWKGYDENKSQRWFLCLDDDDPPEMVLRIDDKPRMKKNKYCEFFPELDFIRYTTRNVMQSHRMFGGRNKFRAAAARWCHFTKVPPPPQKYDAVSKCKPSYMGHWYDLRNINVS